MHPVILLLIGLGALDDAIAAFEEARGRFDEAELIHDFVETEAEGADAANPPAGLQETCKWLNAATDADCRALAAELRKLGGLVRCGLCGRAVPASTAHLHDEDYVGDECCWDERLRSSE